MTPKEKAKQLVDLLGSKLMALYAANEAVNDYNSTTIFYFSKVKILPKHFWLEVIQEIEAL